MMILQFTAELPPLMSFRNHYALVIQSFWAIDNIVSPK